MPESETKPTALLVTSSAHSSRLLGKQLREHFQALVANNAEAAWEQLQGKREIALVISDLALVVDGFGLLERIRSAGDSWLAATPVLLLVGENDTDEQRELGFQCGATDFVNLPFSSVELTVRARLHANIFVQQAIEPNPGLSESPGAANLLQQLSQRNFFASRAQQEMSFSRRHRTSFSLCKLHLDNLKAMVDDFDKATAVTALKAVATVAQQTLRREDSLCYAGGADFLLLYPATNGIGASSALNRIFRQVSGGRLKIAGKPVPVTLSGAIHSCIASEQTSLESVFQALDGAISKARAQGGNQWVSSSSGGEERSLSLDRALRQIEQGRTAELEPQALTMMANLVPLMQFGNHTLGLGIEESLAEIEKRLQKGGD